MATSTKSPQTIIARSGEIVNDTTNPQEREVSKQGRLDVRVNVVVELRNLFTYRISTS